MRSDSPRHQEKPMLDSGVGILLDANTVMAPNAARVARRTMLAAPETVTEKIAGRRGMADAAITWRART